MKIITLAFMNPEIVKRSMNRLYKSKNPDLPIEHHMLFQHYPIEKQKNRAAIEKICLKHKIELHDAGKNLGLHGGFNYIFSQLNMKDDEVFVGYDPDSFPVGLGWDMALLRAIEGSGGEIVWSSLMNPRSRSELIERGYDKGSVDGYIEVWKTRVAVVNSICAFKYGWIKKVGFTEPRPFYGHFESEMWGKLNGKRWAFLPGWEEWDILRDMHDRDYIEYKWVHSHLATYDGDFESWLALGKPGLQKEAPKQLT